VLQNSYQNVPLEFVHGHISAFDFLRVGNEAVVLSNLLWSWRPPFYDAVFAYHWYFFNWGNDGNPTPADVEHWRKVWLSKLEAYAGPGQMHLLELALLERAAAGLLLDALIVNPEKPIAAYLVSECRKTLTALLEKYE
jgi:hypothetical protein